MAIESIDRCGQSQGVKRHEGVGFQPSEVLPPKAGVSHLLKPIVFVVSAIWISA